jgi:hypothetical protein
MKIFFDIIGISGGIASILALFIVLYSKMKYILSTYNINKIEADKQVDNMLKNYRDVSNLASARSDLGFLLLNSIEEYRNLISDYSIWICFFSMCSMLTIMLSAFLFWFNKYISIMAFIGVLILIIYTIKLNTIRTKYVKIAYQLNSHYKDLWIIYINKNIKNKKSHK